MTTYIDGKAVGVGTIRAEIGVSGNVLHDSTLKGNGNTEPLGVDTEVIATTNQVGNLATTLGTQVANIEHKIPDGTTGTNSLVNKQILAQTSYTKAEVDAKVSSVYKFKGSVSTYNSLPSTATTGDVYNVADTGANYAWDGSKWDKLSETIDLTAYATTEYVTAREQDIRDDYMAADADLQTQINGQATAIAGKQDKLTAGSNITIVDNVISATGGGAGNVLHDSTLTGAGTSASPLGLSESVKDEIAGKQDKLTAGENITIEDGVISATGGGAGGDYLPLSGGTVSGDVTVEGTFKVGAAIFKEQYNILTITPWGGMSGYQLSSSYFRGTGTDQTLGGGGRFWANVYTKKLNNGADIAVPTSGGTMVVATPPTEDGSYVLKCVITDGVPTVSWVKE